MCVGRCGTQVGPASPPPSVLTEQAQPGVSLSAGWGPISLGAPGSTRPRHSPQPLPHSGPLGGSLPQAPPSTLLVLKDHAQAEPLPQHGPLVTLGVSQKGPLSVSEPSYEASCELPHTALGKALSLMCPREVPLGPAAGLSPGWQGELLAEVTQPGGACPPPTQCSDKPSGRAAPGIVGGTVISTPPRCPQGPMPWRGAGGSGILPRDAGPGRDVLRSCLKTQGFRVVTNPPGQRSREQVAGRVQDMAVARAGGGRTTWPP